MPNLFDSANYPTSEPLVLVAGDRWVWKRSDLDADYPVASYSLKYALRLEGKGQTEVEITASESGTDYVVEVASATTTTYTPGRYRWQAYITRTSDAERITLDSGTVEVRPNRDTASDDPRTHARRVLAQVEAAIEALASRTAQSYSVLGRTVTYRDIPELLTLRDKYRAEARSEEAAERLAKGLGDPRNIGLRFNRV